MYANFAHFFIPNLCGFLSFLINPLTAYIVRNDKKLQLGNYLFLLFYFAGFNLMCSLVDVLAPVCVINHRYAFSVFITDGPFNLFLVLFNDKFLNRYFLPYGMFFIIVYTLFHIGFWTVTCFFYIGADFTRRQYIRQTLLTEHRLDSMNITLVIAQYNEGPPEPIQKTWIAIGSMTILSVFSLALIFVLGYKIIKKLRSQHLNMSEKTKALQEQLMKALIAQAAIPTCVSFSPCLFAWYQPVFGYDQGRWLQLSAGIAVSTFPCLDPIALVIFVPPFRRQFKKFLTFMIPKKHNQTTCSPPIHTRSQHDK